MSHAIDEYKELRSEIRYYLEAGQKNENLALVVFGVAMAARSAGSHALVLFDIRAEPREDGGHQLAGLEAA